MISTQRNQKIVELARQIQSQPALRDGLQNLITESNENWQELSQQIEMQPAGMEFLNAFQNLLDQYLDVSYGKGAAQKSTSCWC